MAVTLTEDYTELDPGTVIANWTGVSGSLSMPAQDTTSQVEGTTCIAYRVQSGAGSAGANHGSIDVTNNHVRIWFRPSQSIETYANTGGAIRFATDTDGQDNFGEIKAFGGDRAITTYNGWISIVADMRYKFDTASTTPPPITALVWTGINTNFLSGNGKELPIFDQVQYGTTLIIGGGTTGARGTWDEISTSDESNGFGLLFGSGGAFFSNTGLEFGNTVSATSYFEDSNQVIFFNDMPVSGSFYKISHVGNATGINHFQLGTSSGTGIAKEGSGGGVFKATGSSPFRIEAINTNVDVVSYFGTTFTNPSTLYDDAFRDVKVEDNGTGFTDITFNANAGAGTTNANAMPTTQALNDALYFGHDERFYEININLAIGKGGTWIITPEYYNGSTWASLTDVTDGTSSLTTTGAQTITYAIPDNWTANIIDTDTRYWIRLRISSFTSSGTTPTITSGVTATNGVSAAMAGDIRWEDSVCEAIRCVYTNMGSIRVRNGAFLKKSIISNSVVPTKHAALDLGSTDPTANTVRDLTIQNCIKAILLKGTGNVTYNFRNIKFANNTNDVRVDFGVSDIVTINILENGDTPTIDNVNSSTIIINNSVSVGILTKDTSGGNIQNARIIIEADTGGSLPAKDSVTITASTTTASVTHTAHNMVNNDWVIIRDVTNSQLYNGIFQISNVTTNAYDYTMTGSPPTPAVGTITSTFRIMQELTLANGTATEAFNFTTDQPIKGSARKGSVSPFYKSALIAGTITSAGFSATITMGSDE